MSDNRREALEALRDKVKAGNDIQPREFRVIAPEGLIANDDLYEFWIDAWVNAEKAHNGSLDAAKALHKAVLPDLGWEVTRVSKYPGMIPGSSPFEFRADVGWGTTWVGRADDPARAWLLSILSALISETPKRETP